MTHQTKQESFWAGEFGDSYTRRNRGRNQIASNIAYFSRALKSTGQIKSIIEFGSNIGLNLLALRQLHPSADLSAVEINREAARELNAKLPNIDLHLSSIFDFTPNRAWDLVLTKGLLIHLDPKRLPQAYEVLYRSAERYILLSEYYNPEPVEVLYRGHKGKLFKRDFAGEILNRYQNLFLMDYGFVYHRDPNFPQDDMNWFLIEKR